MEKPLELGQKFALKGTFFLVAVALALGLFFRFINLDRKPYWSDEVHTSILVSGHTFDEQNTQLKNGKVITASDLQRFQAPDPDQNLWESGSATVNNLALEDNRHTPLYYLLVTIWLKFFNHSVAVTRSLSVLVSLLAFPCVYWLCQELFGSPLVGWLTMALVAVSPVHVLYAQEARPYSLLIVTILLSSAALLRAMRIKTLESWSIYGLSIALGLYTQILFGLVAIGHGIYVAIIERVRTTQVLISYSIGSVLGLLLFTPWILVMLLIKPRYDAQTEWQLEGQGFLPAVARWCGFISRAFFDFNLGPGDSLRSFLPIVPLILILLALIAYSIYFLCRTAPQRVWLFILTLIGVTGLALMLPDLILGQRRGTTRFIFPCILGIQMSLAYLFASQIANFSKSVQEQKRWKVATVILLSVGIISCINISQAENWWNKGQRSNKHNFEAANIINQESQPLLVSDTSVKRIQTLSYDLDSKVKFQLVDSSNIPEISANFSRVFFFEPSELLRAKIEQKYGVPMEPVSEQLWSLVLPNTTQ